MTKMLKKLATATVGAAICLVAFKANPAQAAKFAFYRNSSFLPMFGHLFFDDATSGLTGIGREEVTLLNGNLDFSLTATPYLFPYNYKSWTNSDFLTAPVFTFESGSLIGMNLNLPPKTFNGFYSGPGGFSWTETMQVFVQDANYRKQHSWVIRGGYNIACDPFTPIPDPPYFIYDPEKCRVPDSPPVEFGQTGQISFATLVPFERPTSLPEPASVVGLSLLGLAFLLKKKNSLISSLKN